MIAEINKTSLESIDHILARMQSDLTRLKGLIRGASTELAYEQTRSLARMHAEMLSMNTAMLLNMLSIIESNYGDTYG